MNTKIETNADYHSHPAISSSGLKKIYQKSVYHHLVYKHETKPSMIFGSAVHSYILEGEASFNKEFFVWDKPDLRYNENKKKHAKAMERAGSRQLLSEDEFAKIQEIQNNFFVNELADEYTKGTVELSHYGNYKGVPIKVRPDCYNKEQNWISDIKTCQDNSPRAFRRDIYNWAYHLQAAAYCTVLGVPIENFRFLAVETKHPYTVEVYGLSDDLIEAGKKAFEKALEDWRFYLETGITLKHKTDLIANDGALII